MSWLPIYATPTDFEEVFEYLNNDKEIAFIVANGTSSWIAHETAEFNDHSWYCLWHLPSGPLPLEKEVGTTPGTIHDPWAGWTEIRTGGRADRPWFGDSPKTIWLEAHTNSRQTEGAIAMSEFSWIGNYWRPVGQSADPSTEKYWNRLCRYLKKDSCRIPRSGPLDGPKAQIWALREALQQIRDGRSRDINPSG
jgi:hypothetical protein